MARISALPVSTCPTSGDYFVIDREGWTRPERVDVDVFMMTAGSYPMTGSLDLDGHRAINIGSCSTDFSASGGLTLAQGLTVSACGLNITGSNIFSSCLNMSNAPIVNIGAAGTDFSASGGLTLAQGLTVSACGLSVTGSAGFAEDETISASVADGYAAVVILDPGYTVTNGSAWTISRHNYIDVNNPSETETSGTITITDAAVMRFDAAAGTHKAVDAGTTKSTASTVNAWLKLNVNGAIYYAPMYTSKTT